jgi:hypothetical protein
VKPVGTLTNWQWKRHALQAGNNPSKRGTEMSLQAPFHAARFNAPSDRDLPRKALADLMHLRDADWLDEMKAKLAAVEAWRGVPTHHSRKNTTS